MRLVHFIFAGEATLGPVVDHTLDIFKAKFLYFVKNINAMDDLFEVSFSKLADGGKPFSR
jgi:DNA topoisomerase-3